MRLPWIAALLALAGAALVLAGALVGPASFGIEGAYFTRASGTPAYSGVFTDWGSGDTLFSIDDGNLWIGAGAVCLLMALAALLGHRAGLRIVRAGVDGNQPG